MTRLFFHGCSPPDMLVSKLEQALHRHQNEALSSRRLGDSITLKYENTRISASPRITTLLLSAWDFVRIDLSVLRKLMEFIREVQVKELILRNCFGNDERNEDPQKRRIEYLAKILSSSPSLSIIFDKQQANMPRCILDGFLQTAKMLPTPSHRVKCLKLQGVTLTKSLVDTLRIALPPSSLQCLEVSSRITLMELDRKRLSVFGILGTTQTTQNATCEQTVRSFSSLLRHQSLKTLKLENCHIPDGILARVLQSLRKEHLRTLSIRGNLAQEETMQVLSDWFSEESTHVEHLDLAWQRQYGCSNNCSSFSLQMPSLAKIICHNQHLRSLSIAENHLSNEDMKLLCSALRRNKGLVQLDLRDCLIQINGFRVLSKILPDVKILRLNLSGTQRVAGTTLKQLLVKPLFQNMYLQDLALPHVESKSLEWLLEWNRVGRRVLVEQEPGLPLSLWPRLLSRANAVGEHASDHEPVRHAASSIYYLLREGGFELLSNYYDMPDETSSKKEATRISISDNTSNETRQISPCSTCDEDDEGGSSTSVFATNSIRQIEETSGEIELKLEKKAGIAHPHGVCTRRNNDVVTQPSPLMARPRLVSNKKSQSFANDFNARLPLATMDNQMKPC